MPKKALEPTTDQISELIEIEHKNNYYNYIKCNSCYRNFYFSESIPKNKSIHKLTRHVGPSLLLISSPQN